MTPAALSAIIFAAAIFIGAVLFLIIEIYAVILGHIKGAPYVRSKKEKIKVMLELAQIKPVEVAVDLGSGDGSILIEAARRGGVCVGIEINPFLVWYSRSRIRKLGLQEKARIVRCDFRKYPLHEADIVFLYLWPGTNEKLREKLERELKPGARVVSNAFPIPGWKHIMEKDRVYLYQM